MHRNSRGMSRVTCHPSPLNFIIFIWVDIGISNKKTTVSHFLGLKSFTNFLNIYLDAGNKWV